MLYLELNYIHMKYVYFQFITEINVKANIIYFLDLNVLIWYIVFLYL